MVEGCGNPNPDVIPLSERQRAYAVVGLFGVILFYFFPALIFVLPHLHIVFFSKPLHLLSPPPFFLILFSLLKITP